MGLVKLTDGKGHGGRGYQEYDPDVCCEHIQGARALNSEIAPSPGEHEPDYAESIHSFVFFRLNF